MSLKLILNCNMNKKFSITFLSILLLFTFYCKERVIEIERSSIFIYAYPTEGKSPLSVKFYASIAYSYKFGRLLKIFHLKLYKAFHPISPYYYT